MIQKPDYSIDFNNLIQYVPQNLRNSAVKSLIDNLFNRQMTHDESIPMFGYIGNKPSSIDDRTPKIAQPTPERDINSIIPVLSFNLGTTKYAYTVQDIINKANAVGITSESRQWLYSQANNYLPPIDIDKFANYFNYYWVAKSLPSVPSLPWNTELLPEYYCIATPTKDSSDKQNVLAASEANTSTILTGTGFEDQLFTLVFSSPTEFTVIADGPLPGNFLTTQGQAFPVAITSVPVPPMGYFINYTLGAVTPGVPSEETFSFEVSNGVRTETLVTFSVARDPIYDSSGTLSGTESFAVQDTFLIDTVFLSTNYSITFSGSPGVKGKLKGIHSLNEYQKIDGITVHEGDRVLIKDNDTAHNGLYIVSPQGWVRASDYNGTTIAPGARVWVKSGLTNAGKLFTSGVGNTWDLGVLQDSNTNDWQEGNFWVHGTDLASMNLSKVNVVQGTRPIIEYRSDVKLNSYVSNGSPSDTGRFYNQTKAEFNQLPLFDLFRYDGTHSGLVSSIFYYVEDLSADLDVALQKRVKTGTGDSADYIFDHGMSDSQGSLLFYSTGTSLKTIWHPGYQSVQAVDEVFIGAEKGEITSLIPTASAVTQLWTIEALSSTEFAVTGSVDGAQGSAFVGVPYSNIQFSFTMSAGLIPFITGEKFEFSISPGPLLSSIVFTGNVKGTITNIVPAHQTQQQVWTLRATSGTTFEVQGSKTKELPTSVSTLTVDVPYVNDEFSCLISAGSEAFTLDDLFVFRIGNLETPRYAFRDSTGAISDLYGGSNADTSGIGAYQSPRTFSNNPYSESRSEVPEGTLYGHLKGILQNQLPGLENNYAFGGSIKGWSEQQTLLASLLIQKDLTPISMIDSAQRHYENSLNAISDLYQKHVLQYFATNGTVDVDGSVSEEAKLNSLLDFILEKRSTDNDVRTVLYDSTSPVLGFPITLPSLGICELQEPKISFVNAIGRNLIIHHDGHGSELVIDTIDFRKSILNDLGDVTVTRSDGAVTPAVGSFGPTAPVNPYKSELWIRSPDGAMLAFDVTYDNGIPVTAVLGETSYDRTTGTLSTFNGSIWVQEPSPLIAWKVIDLADTLNQLILQVETRRYKGLNPNSRKVDFAVLDTELGFNEEMKRELFSWSAINSLDPLGSDYVSTDAFTWNYSFASIPGLSTVPARWFNVIKAHQGTVPGVIQTDAPNLEPWKLLGFSTYSSFWTSLTSLKQSEYTPYKMLSDLSSMIDGGTVRAIKTTVGSTTLMGLQSIDGVLLNEGDKVLLQNESVPANSGLYIASAGLWLRTSDTLVQDLYVSVTDGSTYKGTVWALSTSVPTPNTSPVLFKQVRSWTDVLWADIKIAHPTLKLSVDTVRDTLLPPYVAASNPQSINALTTVYPSGRAAPYNFNEGSPVQTYWETTSSYKYSLARALFRYDPLQFLGFCWGFNWVEVDGILYDGFNVDIPGHKRFKLHGESILNAERDLSHYVLSSPVWAGVGSELTFEYSAYKVSGGSRFQNFSVFENGSIIGFIDEGTINSVSTSSGTLSNFLIEDFGVPFRIGDKFIVSALGEVSFISEQYYKFLGFGQVFTQALREMSIDASGSFAIQAYRGWDVNMGHRAGGLIVSDDLKIRTDSDTLSTSSFELLFKKNSGAKDLWVQGLRITVQAFGSSTSTPSGMIPSSDGADWTFRIEGYNPRYSKISYYSLDTSSTFETFNVLDQSKTSTVWKHFTETLGIVNSHLPLTITGIQNVVNFLFGYSELLVQQGWIFNSTEALNVDAETGRNRTWQLDIEKFINGCYKGIDLDQGQIINPFIDKIAIRQDTGILSDFDDVSLFDVTAHSGVFDILGTRFTSSELFILRGNAESEFSAVAPMYSAHVQLDEFEHLVIFNYFVEDSLSKGILYDPFSGAGVRTFKFNGRRQGSKTLRPEFGGHYLLGSEVRQNIQASTDNITKYYDANAAFDSESTSKNALALLGFSTKDYFSNLDISDKAQFNFWRGLIQSKGTNSSIDAYLNNARFEDVKLDEYWAYKVSEYGDSRQRTYPELKLSVSDSLQQFTQLQFDAPIGSELPNFTQVQRFDESRWFSIDDMNHDAYFISEVLGTYTRADTVPGTLYDLPFVADLLVLDPSFIKINARTVQATGTSINVLGYGAGTPKFNPIKLFNYVDNELISEIPFWHPAASQHTPTALESINIISKQNPAKYNFSSQVINNNSYDPLRPWGSNEVGRTWFNTSNLEYIPYYDETIFTDRAERLSRWGALADFASIDVLEWVQSTVSPSEYNALALIQAGDADLDSTLKAAGEVALQETYSRNRIWNIRPIAWSEASVPTASAHPAFKSSYDQILYINGETISLESGLFSDHGVVPGMRIGAWNDDENDFKALNEAIVLDEFTKVIIGSPLPVPNFNVSVSVKSHTSLNGQLLVTGNTDTVQRASLDGTPISIWDNTVKVKIIGNNGAIIQEEVLDVISGVDGGQALINDPGQPYIAQTPAIPAVPGTNGYQIVFFGQPKDYSSDSGLVPSSTYSTSISIDGAPSVVISITAISGQTFGDIISLVNASLAGAPVSIDSGNIIIKSGQTSTSSVSISSDTLFASLSDYDSLGLEVLGTDTIVAQPAVQGQPYIAPTSQPYIAPSYLYGAELVLEAGQKLSYTFADLGLQVNVEVLISGTYPGDAIQEAIVNSLGVELYVRDATHVSGVANWIGTYPEISNNPLDTSYIAGLGWRAWNVPTQADLTADSKQPNSRWKPYLGDYTQISNTSLEQIQEAISTFESPLTLNDGTEIQRYSTSWGVWSVLKNEIRSKTQISSTDVILDHSENVDSTKASVYVNGITQLSASYSVLGKTVSVKSVPFGSKAVSIVRKYEPTAKELAFNPEVLEDYSFQTQYKKDYEYVSVPVRDIDGTPTSTLYYFWVKNKSVPAKNKKISIQSITRLLRDGPTNYLTFQNLIGDGSSSNAYRYDAVTISGLSYVVSKDDTFKLRFTRDFTLRDDPQDLDLKDVHTEWSLIRPAQRSRIPEALWKKLTDSVSGEDLAGNTVPALRRSLYDERNGTRTRFGFSEEQTLAPQDLLISTITYTIVNTKLLNTTVPANASGQYPADFIEFLDFNQSAEWFSTPSSSRKVMTDIWTTAKPSQINEIFFAVLNDILANNYELTDLFKTSRISAYSIKVINPMPIVPTYE
jgi:hypothetical protein